MVWSPPHDDGHNHWGEETRKLGAQLAQLGDPLQLLSGLFAHAPVGLQIYGVDGRCLLTNQAFRDIFGAEPGPDYRLFEDPQIEKLGIAGTLRRAFAGEQVWLPATWYDTSRQPLRRGVGRRCAVAFRAFPLRDVAGQVSHVVFLFEDVTEEVLSEARFSQVFRALPIGALFSRLSDRRFVEVNTAWERMTGYTRDEMIGRTSVELNLWVDESQRDALFAAYARDRTVRDFAARLRQKSGAIRDVLLNMDVAELFGEPCLLLIAHDVTDLHLLERELRHSQKMEALGRLAGGLAHDFNNILTAVGGSTTLLLDGLPESDPRRAHAEQIKRSTQRAGQLTRQLLAFSRKQPEQPVAVDPGEVVRAVAEMLQRMIGADVTLRVELEATGWVRAPAGALEQVLMNLAVNARDAMPRGGTLTLRTRDGGDGAAARVVLEVVDTGVGIDAETRARMFEPFYTTKEQGKGTGLGLSMVYAIVARCGGHISVESVPGAGATFAVQLPREEVRSEAPLPSSPVAAAATGSETILVVEDDDGIREFLQFVLAALGYRVLEAPDGAAALELATRLTERIDLLVSDVNMPRMDGFELVRELAARRPELRVLLISGYPGDTSDELPPAIRGRLLEKPFEREDLARAVRDVLDGVR